MSSFGAMARAAEYAAAANAKQRQANREAEEHSLPPQCGPISLSAFTKAQLPSRNKGIKAWKPLTFDDISEANEDDDVLESAHRSPTPKGPAKRWEHDVTSIMERRDSEDSNVLIPITVNIPRAFNAPSSGSISETCEHSTYPENSFRSNGHLRIQRNSLPIDIQETPAYKHEGFPFDGHNLDVQKVGHISNGGAMSPTKQEVKIARMKYMYHPPILSSSFSQGLDFTHSLDEGSGGYIDAPQSSANPHCQRSPLSSFGAEAHSGRFPSGLFYEMQAPIQIGSEVGSTPPIQIQGKVSRYLTESKVMAPAACSTFPAIQGLITNATQTYSTVHGKVATPQYGKGEAFGGILQKSNNFKQLEYSEIPVSQTRPSRAANDQTQFLMNKLLSWEAKSYSRKAQSFIPWESAPPTDTQRKFIEKLGSTKGLDGAQIEAIAMAINNPAPGFSIPDFMQTVSTKADEEDNFSVESGEMIRTEEWYRLKPPSNIDRQRLRRIMSKAAKDVTNSVQEPTIGSQNGTTRGEEAQRWFEEDNRADKGLRDFVKKMSQQHITRRTNDTTITRNAQASAKEDEQITLNAVLSDVIINMSSYFANSSSSQPRDEFFKVKRVPEFAIERDSLLGGCQDNFSYFDDVQDGFHLAPARIARDPRFHPQIHEGPKVKPDEEWKLRHELYGGALSRG